MGAFSNGTEGEGYMDAYCIRCVNCGDHQDGVGCAVWDLHLLFNSDQHEDSDRGRAIALLLDGLIPVMKDGSNGQCLMFREKKPESTRYDGETFLEWFDRTHAPELVTR